jgi:hypothetical protein
VQPIAISPTDTRKRRDWAGIAASVTLHAAVLVLLLLLMRPRPTVPVPVEHFVPVSLVAQSQGPAVKPGQQRAAGPVRHAPPLPRARIAIRAPSATAPRKTTEPVDALEMQLKALSKLRAPNTDTRLSGDAGTAALAESGQDDESGGRGDYNTRDIIRAQILRRWSLDMTRLGNRRFVIDIRVALKRDGTVLTADIVDRQRMTTDAVFRWIAVSARNAVILSSPLTLPPGIEAPQLELTLRLDPRDALQ